MVDIELRLLECLNSLFFLDGLPVMTEGVAIGSAVYAAS